VSNKLYKKGSHIILTNYRLISLLSIFNQLLEKIKYKCQISFIEKHNILYKKQFGFCPNQSKIQAVLSTTDKSRRRYWGWQILLWDISWIIQTLNTVNHNILLQKLEHYGIRGIVNEWLKSYLENRKLFVSIQVMSNQKHWIFVPCAPRISNWTTSLSIIHKWYS
jgi:hypothetical protein